MAVDPASLANLNLIKPGERRNPYGINAARRLKIVRDILDEADDEEPKISRIRAVVVAMCRDAKSGSKVAPQAGTALLQQYAGRPQTVPDRVVPPEDHSESSGMLDVVLSVYRERLLSGDLSEAALGTLAALLMSSEKAEAEIIARILGDRKGVTTALKERAEAVIAKLESRTAEALPAAEPAPSEEKPCP